MDFVLFVFGKHDNPELMIKTVCQNIAETLDINNIKYYFGDESSIITFTKKCNFDSVKKDMGKILKNNQIMYVLLPYSNDNISVQMVNEMYEHLFGEESQKTNDSFFDIENKTDTDGFIQLFNELLEDDEDTIIKLKPRKKSLNELLDKINEVGFNNLSQEEKKQLEIYSKK